MVWSYLQNPFENVTKNNFKRMVLMARDHFDKLTAAATTSPAVQNIYTAAAPIYQSFNDLYTASMTDTALYAMRTQEFETLLAVLRGEKIKRWDAQIQSIYLDNTPQYKALLPQNRTPFQAGAYELRISAVRALASSLAAFPDLTHVKTDVEDFLKTLENQRTIQQGLERKTAVNSDDLETARKALAKTMHKVWAQLIIEFNDDLQQVENFYELKYLRSKEYTAEEGENASPFLSIEAPAELIEAKAIEGLDENSQIYIEGDEKEAVIVFIGKEATDSTPPNAALLEAGQSLTVWAKDISNGQYEKLIVDNSKNKTKIKLSVQVLL